MMGVRFGVSGWQAKGSVAATGEVYKFNFSQVNADYVLDVMTLLDGYKHNRLVQPYLFAGIGAGSGFNNDDAQKYLPEYSGVLKRYWENTALFVMRAGLGANVNVAEKLAIGLELNTNCYPEKFNSKQRVENSRPDWQFNLMLGLTYALGSKTAPSKVYAAKVAAEMEAKALAEKAEAERLAAEKAAKEAAAKKAAEEAAAKKAAEEAAAKEAEEAAARRAAVIAENSIQIFFSIDSHYINKTESKKLEAFAKWMTENPDFKVYVIGYADAKTGTSPINARVSERRVKAVAEKLVKMGVSTERISTIAKGDKEQPYTENKKNRVVFCTLF